MNKKYKKILATGLAINMTLINIPYNVFASSDIIEEIILNEDNALSEEINFEDKKENEENNIEDNLIIEEDDLIIKENNEIDSDYIKNETVVKNAESTIENDSIFIENHPIENLVNKIDSSIEDKKSSKLSIPIVTNYASSFAGGDGSQENPYQISNALELARLAYLVNEEDLDTTGMYFELTADIDLSDFDSDNNDSNGNWTPIGYKLGSPNYENFAFKGVFNGNNHTVSNMAIKEMDVNAGLFGVVVDAEFKNIVLDSFNVSNIDYASALACHSTGNLKVDNVSVSNFIYEYDKTANSYQQVGVISAYVYGLSSTKVVINDVEVIDSIINNNVIHSNRSDIGGGLLGCVRIDDVEIINSSIDIDIKSGKSGGVIGDFSSSDLKGFKIKNVNVNILEKHENNLNSFGGLIGNTYASIDDESVFLVEDCNIIINSEINNGFDSKDNFGGIFGYVGGSINSVDNNIKCINTDITFLKNTSAEYIGGILGLCYSNMPFYIDNCTVEGDLSSYGYAGGVAGNLCVLKCNNFKYSGNLNGVGSYSVYAGGLIGGNYSSKLNVSNIVIEGNITGNIAYAGGLCGYTGLYNALEASDIKIDMDMSGKLVGGLFGQIVGNYSVDLSNIAIGSEDNYLQFNNSGTSIDNYGVSGIISCSDVNSVTINNSNIYVTLDGKNSFTGGIVSAMKKGDLMVDNVNIVGTITNKSIAGGVLGNLINGNVNISNLNVEVDIDASEGNSNNTGGIIGMSSSEGSIVIKDSKYIGSLKGNYYTGGIIGMSINSNSTIDLSNIEVKGNLINDALSGTLGGILGFSMSKNVNMSNVCYDGELTASGTVGGIIGQGVANIDGAKVIAIITNNGSHESGGVVGASEWGGTNMYLSNLVVEADITAINSRQAVGGIVGRNNANLTVENTIFNGRIVNKGFAGGIIGHNISSILTISNCDATVDIDSQDISGGICGLNVTGSDLVVIKENKSKGIIKTKAMCGGVVGRGIFTKIINNAVDMDIESGSNSYNIGGIVGDASNAVVIGNSFKGSVKGFMNVGGICGLVSGNQEISKNISIGTVEGVNNLGGVFGLVNGSVVADNNAFIGSVNGDDKVGGLVGALDSTYGGNVNISHSYTASNITGLTNINSVIGYVNNITLTTDKVYYDNILSPSEDIHGIGLPTQQMQGYATYDNMDFDYDNIWKANKEYYPTFKQLNTAPELSGNDIELILNQNYNLLDYVDAEDFENDDFTIEIKQTNLDISKIGDYTATFVATDIHGLSSELTLNIKVVMESPVINANDITLYVGDKFNPLDKVTAIDINGNDITEHIKVIENTVDTAKKGEYKVVYQVDSLERLSTAKEIKVTVKEKDNNNNNNNSATNDETTSTDKPQTSDTRLFGLVGAFISSIGLYCINRKEED